LFFAPKRTWGEAIKEGFYGDEGRKTPPIPLITMSKKEFLRRLLQLGLGGTKEDKEPPFQRNEDKEPDFD